MDAVQALVQLGARMELRNEDGETALDLALSLDDELMVNICSSSVRRSRVTGFPR